VAGAGGSGCRFLSRFLRLVPEGGRFTPEDRHGSVYKSGIAALKKICPPTYSRVVISEPDVIPQTPLNSAGTLESGSRHAWRAKGWSTADCSN